MSRACIDYVSEQNHISQDYDIQFTRSPQNALNDAFSLCSHSKNKLA